MEGATSTLTERLLSVHVEAGAHAAHDALAQFGKTAAPAPGKKPSPSPNGSSQIWPSALNLAMTMMAGGSPTIMPQVRPVPALMNWHVPQPE